MFYFGYIIVKNDFIYCPNTFMYWVYDVVFIPDLMPCIAIQCDFTVMKRVFSTKTLNIHS